MTSAPDQQGIATLDVTNLSKAFPGTQALTDVDLRIDQGEVHALVGQNGSGKSTFIKILAGFYQPDPGWSATAYGQPLTLGNTVMARAAGLRFVHQDLGLVESESIVDNLALGFGYQTSRVKRIKWGKERKNAAAAFGRLGYDLDVTQPIRTLSPVERTAVAIARALRDWTPDRALLLVLDEPTATMPHSNVERLLELVARVRSMGSSVLYVSHHLDEVMSISDRVTVLRDGRRVMAAATADTSLTEVIEMMTGDLAQSALALQAATERAEVVNAAPALELTDLASAQVEPLSLQVRPGEIVGIAGLAGSGRESIASMIFGGRPRTGTVRIHDKTVNSLSPGDAIEAGIGFVPGDRRGEGLVLAMTVQENMTLPNMSDYWRGFIIRKDRETSDVRTWMNRLNVVASGPGQLINDLSGGNQQKVVIGKWLRLKPKVLLLDEPTQGVDVAAKAGIHQLVEQAAAEGAAVLICSSDEQELVDVCDSVHVMYRGRVVATLDRASLTSAALAHASTFGAADSEEAPHDV